jgi:hypothetical protein
MPARSPAKSSLKLDKLEAKIAKARERLREIESEARFAKAEVARLDQELEEHFAQPDADPRADHAPRRAGRGARTAGPAVGAADRRAASNRAAARR